jgi:DNA-binding transcriptional regulator YdaS (Cro superfamily)
MRSGLRYSSDDPRVVACKLAIKAAGGITRLAKALGISPQAVYWWEMVPPERCLQVAEISEIPEHVLRPDVYRQKKKQSA